MFAFKKKYFLIIESIKDINLRNIKKYNKFLIIYRNNADNENYSDIKRFRNTCKLKSIKFFVANNMRLAVFTRADGIYLSSYNKIFRHLRLKSFKFSIIGSAHNAKEINRKLNQGCSYILLSKLFFVDYKKNSSFLGVVKFNNYARNTSKDLIPLGGIKEKNLNSLRSINCNGLAIMSEIKKKPAITSRPF